MTVLDMKRSDMDEVINALDSSSDTRVSILNEGQLNFAIEKSSMSLHGKVLYPEMHQKAAVLMETLCKSHTLTDGNKRASIMAAEYLANINGGILVIPLKTARLAVDCAMDADDKMSEEIAAWFKTHIAHDELELAVMFEEVVEERDVVTTLLDQRRYDEAEQIVDDWLAFGSNPEGKQVWSSLVKRWKSRDEVQRLNPMAARPHFSPWISLTSGLHIDDRMSRIPSLPDARIARPVHVGHSMEDLEKAEVHIRQSVERLRGMSCDADTLWNAGIMLENFGHYKPAVRFYDRLLDTGVEGNARHVLSHKLVCLAFSEQYAEAHATVDRLAEQPPFEIP